MYGTTLINPDSDQLRNSAIAGAVPATYGITSPTKPVICGQARNQVIFDLTITPAATNTIFYFFVEFSQKRFRDYSPTRLRDYQEFNDAAPATARWTRQTILDVLNAPLSTNGILTVDLDQLEYKIAPNTTNTINIQLPVKNCSYACRLYMRAENPGASLVDVWGTTGSI